MDVIAAFLDAMDSLTTYCLDNNSPAQVVLENPPAELSSQIASAIAARAALSTDADVSLPSDNPT
jgi:hypothetical protein